MSIIVIIPFPHFQIIEVEVKAQTFPCNYSFDAIFGLDYTKFETLLGIIHVSMELAVLTLIYRLLAYTVMYIYDGYFN